MADYAVGGIKLDFNLGNTSDITNKLNAMANGLDTIKKAIQKFDKVDTSGINNFTNSLNGLANVNYKGITDNLNKISSNLLENNFKQVTSSFSSFTKSLKSIENINFGNFISSLDKLAKVDFTPVVNAMSVFNELNGKSLNGFASAIRAINKIGKGVDFTSIEENFKLLANAVDPFIEKIRSASVELQAFNNALNVERLTNEIDKVKLRLQKVEEQAEHTKNKMSSVFNLKTIGKVFGKLYATINFAKGFTRIGQNLVSYAIDFTETLNKFQVSFGNLSSEATTFVNNMTDAFNLSTESIMNYMSTFNNMIKSLGGIDAEKALGVSETLTQLALDYASLMNTSVDTAMKQFQSVLAGQTKAIRTTSGVDVTDNTIYQMYQALGGTKTQRQLSQTEKRLLRIYAVEQQLKNLGAFQEITDENGNVIKTFGDLEKTLNNTSNTLKRISETFKEFGRYFGQILLQYFKPLIEKTLSLVIVLKEIAKAYTEAKNITGETYDAIIGGAEEATEANNELNKSMGLLSFDRFEALSKNDVAEDLDLDAIVKAIKDYTDPFKNVVNSAQELADKWLLILGYEKQTKTALNSNNEEIEKTVYVESERLTLLKAISRIIKTLLGMGIAIAIAKIVTVVAGLFVKLGSVFAVISKVSKLGLIVGISLLIQGITEGNKVLIITGTILTTIFSTMLLIKAFNSAGLIAKLMASIIKFNTLIGTTGEILMGIGAGIALVVAGVVIFKKMDEWSAKTKVLVGVLGTLASVLISVAVGWMMVHGAMTLGAGIPIILGAMVAGTASITSLVKGVKDIGQYADGGFPTKGQMFVANESGAELVGNIGGRTAVANNDMIVQAIEQASYRGIVKGMAVSSNKQDINIDLRGFNADEVARAIYTPLLKEFKRNGVNIQGA